MSIANQVEQLRQDIDGVYEAGRKSQYDEFWDNFQRNGNRTTYSNAFGGAGWTDTTFNPKYAIKPTSAQRMFYDSDVTDPCKILKEKGLSLDTSNTTDFQYMFSQCTKLTHVGEINMKKVKTATSCAFYMATNLKTIDKIISSDTTVYNINTFSRLYALENITFEGVIGSNIWFQHSSKLTLESIETIIDSLSVLVTSQTLTLSLVAVNKAFETSEGANDGSESALWNMLCGSRSNWTISLV